jgi:Fic family protein
VSPQSDISALEEKLDLLISLLRIAHREPLQSEHDAVLTDPISKAILDESGGWVSAGELQKAVAQKAKTSVPTVKRRIAELVERGLLKRVGGGAHVEYRTTGLIEI